MQKLLASDTSYLSLACSEGDLEGILYESDILENILFSGKIAEKLKTTSQFNAIYWAHLLYYKDFADFEYSKFLKESNDQLRKRCDAKEVRLTEENLFPSYSELNILENLDDSDVLHGVLNLEYNDISSNYKRSVIKRSNSPRFKIGNWVRMQVKFFEEFSNFCITLGSEDIEFSELVEEA